jgi:iron only hydrogenase large subunit-like protein
MLAAAEIEIQNFDIETENKYFKDARRFSCSGGVSEMVKSHLETQENLHNASISGFSKENMRLIKSFAKGKTEYNFLEVMACENGCINGCNTIAKSNIARKQLKKYATNN